MTTTTKKIKAPIALERIQQVMSGHEWDANTLESIAEIMEDAGYPLEEPE